MAVGAGNLEESRQLLQLRMREENAEPLTEQALADVVVPVAVRPERGLRVVHMQRPEPLEADALVDLGEHAVELLTLRDVVAGGVEMAGVEADAEPLVSTQGVVERRELVDRAADRIAGAGRVLDQQPGGLRATFERLSQRRHSALQADLEAGALVRADMEDDPVGLDRAADVHGVFQRGDRLLIELVVRARQVDQVEGVTDDAADPGLGAALLETLEVGRVVVRRSPRPGALREDLDAVSVDRFDPVDCGVDAAGGRDMGAELHAPDASAWRTAGTAVRYCDGRPCPLRAEPDRLSAHRQRPYGALQLALCPPRGRRVFAADREHGHEQGSRGGNRADPGVAALARSRLGRRGDLPARPDGASAGSREAARCGRQGLRG